MRILTIIILFVAQLSFGQDSSVFHKEIPRYESGELSVYFESTRKNEKLLELDTIENGFDSLQIRIWYHYPKFRPPKNIFIIKNQNSKWTSLLYSYDTDSIETITPKSSISRTLDKLFLYDILTLPNMHDIDGLEDNWVDGESYTIEISDKKHYRLYNYHVL